MAPVPLFISHRSEYSRASRTLKQAIETSSQGQATFSFQRTSCAAMNGGPRSKNICATDKAGISSLRGLVLVLRRGRLFRRRQSCTVRSANLSSHPSGRHLAESARRFAMVTKEAQLVRELSVILQRSAFPAARKIGSS